jgi:hypothetical protein
MCAEATRPRATGDIVRVGCSIPTGMAWAWGWASQLMGQAKLLLFWVRHHAVTCGCYCQSGSVGGILHWFRVMGRSFSCKEFGAEVLNYAASRTNVCPMFYTLIYIYIYIYNFTLWNNRISCVMYKDTVRTAQKTHCVSVIKTSQLMLYREIMAVFSEIHTKHINTLCGQNVELLYVKLAVHIVTTGL